MVVCVFVCVRMCVCMWARTCVCACTHVILVPFLNNRKSNKTW